MPPFVARKRHRSPSPSLHFTVTKSRTPTTANKRRKSTLFEVADAKPKAIPTVEDNKAFLEKHYSFDESSLSGASSDEFEDAPPKSNAKRRRVEQPREEDNPENDEEMDWEDAIVHHEPSTVQAPFGDLELTLDAVPTDIQGLLTNPNGTKKGPSKIERQIRLNTHCMHVQYLLFHNLIRNGWICDKDVQKVLVKDLPQHCEKEMERWRSACGNINGKSKTTQVSKMEKKQTKVKESRTRMKKSKNQRDWGHKADCLEEGMPNLSRGDPLLRLLKVLSAYWRNKFEITAPGLRKQGYKDLRRLEEEGNAFRDRPYDMEEHGECVKNVREFKVCATKCEGSRDVSAQLFTALLRGLGMEARIVASLQPVGFGWNKNEDAHSKKKKAKETFKSITGTRVGKPDCEGEKIPAKKSVLKAGKIYTKQSAMVGFTGAQDAPIHLSDDEQDLSDAPASDDSDCDDDSVVDVTPSRRPTSSKQYDRDLPFPIYWTEVLSPISNTWIPVDPTVLSLVASNPDSLVSFEPRGAKADKAKQVLAYVVAFSADGTAKDVTVRYLKRHMWPGKTKGVRIPVEKLPILNKRGKVLRYEEHDWFQNVLRGYTRDVKNRTFADGLEDAADLQPIRVVREARKSGQETLQGYKSSAEFVLERHLRREEALLPNAKQVKIFTTGKGDQERAEPVYLRKDVVVCRTIESWHKEGRGVKEGEQALKFVPMRAVTTIRKREIEEAERETGEKLKQPLYSRAQTDWIIPPPIKDGVIPKNAFGNMDVYVPTMVPAGSVHIRLKGTAKICRKLEINYAEACTGFEFGNRRAVPVLTGVVVAKEHKEVVIEGWRAELEQKQQKENNKREKVALGMWKKMLTGLKIVERFRREYGVNAESHIQDAIHPMTARKTKNKVALKSVPKYLAETRTTSGDDDINNDEDTAGGFLEESQDVDGGIGEGGFMLNYRSDTSVFDHDFDSGGFIIEEDQNERKIRKSSSNGQLRNPVSLQSLHNRDAGSVFPSEDEVELRQDGGMAEDLSVPPAPSQDSKVLAKASRISGTRRGRGRAGKVTALPCSTTTAKNIFARLTQANEGRRSTLVSPSPSEEADDDAKEGCELAVEKGSAIVDILTPLTAKQIHGRHTTGRRKQAPWKSKDIVKSKYFELIDSEDEDEGLS